MNAQTTNESTHAVERPLTHSEAAAFLSIAPSTLYKLTSKQSGPPFYRLPGGRKLYFNRSELTAWLQANRFSSSEELGKLASQHLNA